MKIFLGYPSERLSDARAIWDFLINLGLTVWFDKEHVLVGEDWRAAREQAQDEADLVIHLISPEMQSRAGEVQREIKRSLDRAKDIPPGSLFLIPILVDGATVPHEIASYQYVAYKKSDWSYRVAKSIARKYEQLCSYCPEELTNYIKAQATAGGRIDLKIHDVDSVRDLQADYFKYRFSSRFFDFINAEISAQVLADYYDARRRETEMPESPELRSTWQCNVSEFYRSDDWVSLTFEYFFYSTGAAHGHQRTATLNFAGENIGKWTINDLFDSESSNLEFLLDYVQLDLKRQLLVSGYEGISFLIDFNEYASDSNLGWTLLSYFNFDNRGLVLHFSPYDVLAYAFGSFEVRIPWDQINDRISKEFESLLKLNPPQSSA